jgi:hypothetical protein
VQTPAKYVHCSWPNTAKPVTSGPPKASCSGHEYEHDRRCDRAATVVAARARRTKVERMMSERGTK